MRRSPTVRCRVFCLSTIGLAIFAYPRRTPDTPIQRVAIPVPEDAAIRRFAASSGPNPLALSPDGRYLAFVAAVGTTSFLWLRPLDSQTANRLGGTEGAMGPFWSPDSQSIAFFAGGRLKRVGVAGGDAAFTVSGTGVLAYWGGTGVPTSQLTWRGETGR